MSVTVRTVRSKSTGRVHPGELVRVQGLAVVGHLSRSLLLGVSPVDGSPRLRKPNGKPEGWRTGRLSRELHLGRFSIGQKAASVSIELPSGGENDEFRALWVSKHPDVLSLEGNTADVIRRETARFMETRNGRPSTT